MLTDGFKLVEVVEKSFGKSNSYYISPDGIVLVIKKDKDGNVLRVWNAAINIKQGCGYPYVAIGTKSVYLHFLVATHYIMNRNNKPWINHIDGNRLNSKVENLQFCTAKENSQHAAKVLRRVIGKTKIALLFEGTVYKSMLSLARKLHEERGIGSSEFSVQGSISAMVNDKKEDAYGYTKDQFQVIDLDLELTEG